MDNEDIAALAAQTGVDLIPARALPVGSAAWVPDAAARETVRRAAAIGIEPKNIRHLVAGPDGKVLSEAKLIEFFAEDLDSGIETVHARLASNLMDVALAGGREGVDASKFFLARKFGWVEKRSVEHTGRDGDPIAIQHTVQAAVDSVRNIMDSLMSAKRASGETPPAQG